MTKCLLPELCSWVCSFKDIQLTNYNHNNVFVYHLYIEYRIVYRIAVTNNENESRI